MGDRKVTYLTSITFQALADPTRRALLELLLSHGSLPAGRIAESFPISRPAISKHLRLLRKAGLVDVRREGRHRYYQSNPEPLKAAEYWLESYRTMWNKKLARLKAFVESEQPAAKHQKNQPKAEGKCATWQKPSR